MFLKRKMFSLAVFVLAIVLSAPLMTSSAFATASHETSIVFNVLEASEEEPEDPGEEEPEEPEDPEDPGDPGDPEDPGDPSAGLYRVYHGAYRIHHGILGDPSPGIPAQADHQE